MRVGVGVGVDLGVWVGSGDGVGDALGVGRVVGLVEGLGLGELVPFDVGSGEGVRSLTVFNGVGMAETAEGPPQPHNKTMKLMTPAHTFMLGLELRKLNSPASCFCAYEPVRIDYLRIVYGCMQAGSEHAHDHHVLRNTLYQPSSGGALRSGSNRDV